MRSLRLAVLRFLVGAPPCKVFEFDRISDFVHVATTVAISVDKRPVFQRFDAKVGLA